MRIIIDLQACQAVSMHRGIGRYSMALALAMARRAGLAGHELQLVLNGRFDASVTAIRAAFDGLLPASQIKLFDLPAPVAEYDRANGWRVRAAEQLREHYLASLKPDVVHVASLFEGLGDDAVASCSPGDGRFDTAVTLYDLIPLLRKEVYLTDPHVMQWYYRKLQALKNAELLLAISGHSRREAMAALQLPAERVINISSAVDQIFQPQTLSAEAGAALRAKFGLRREFIMYTGGVDYRKNIEGLIEAYAMLPEALRRQYQLAVVCSVQEVDRHRLQQLAARCQLGPDDLVLTGFVSDAELVALYNSTRLFVFPSLQEGFGLPALEAMSCGVAVIGSDSSSIPEVIGRADALFDPTRVESICAKMREVLEQPDFSAALAAHGLRQAKRFSWDASAATTLDAFEQLAAQRGARAGQAEVKVKVSVAGRRPRLAYVSPLPPERSGIADYSAELLPELARYYEIDVVLEQDKLSDTWAAANFPRRSVAWFEAHAHQYERIVYHFGNSAFHQHMFGLLERHPGVVVLHDFFMSGITNYAAGASPHPNAYCRALYLSHGYQALVEEGRDGREASVYRHPCNRAVLDHASGIIVHSRHSMALAEHWYGAGSAADWQMIPLLRTLPGTLDKAAARRALGIGDEVFLVCSFGMLALTKCNERIVEAWLTSELGNDAGASLVFVGENDVMQYGKALEARISGRNVRITGFASQADYRLYLTAADAAVQLRTRSRGETSATVLDCLAYRLPTVINAHGSAAEVPAEAAIMLADQFSDAELAAALLQLRQDGALAARLSAAAGAYMDAVHHPARVGLRYRDALEQFAASRGEAALMTALAGIDHTVAPSEADLVATAACVAANRARPGLPHLLVDVSSLLAEGATRPADAAAREALLRRLLEQAPAGLRVEPVALRDGRYHYARQYALALIGRPELTLADDVAELRAGDRLLCFGAERAAPALAARGLLPLVLELDGGGTEPALAALAAALAAGAP